MYAAAKEGLKMQQMSMSSGSIRPMMGISLGLHDSHWTPTHMVCHYILDPHQSSL